MPVIIPSGSRRKFLKRDKPMMDITNLLHRETNLTCRGLEVKPEIFSKKFPCRSDFNSEKTRLFPVHKFPGKEILGSFYYH
jgi:hypothetical protein